MELGDVRRHSPRSAERGNRDAAVLVPIVERADGAHLLFAKRSNELGQHPGQMSFPGGGREPTDDSRRATALREANEEIGLRPEEVSVVGQLDGIATVTDYAVRPFVAEIPDREYVPDGYEIVEIAVLPIAALLDPANYEVERREHPEYGTADVHYFHVDGYTVWGATARILTQFLDLTADWTPPERPAESDATD